MPDGRTESARKRRVRGAFVRQQASFFMDEFDQTKSCWGVAFTAVALFGGFVVVSTALLDDGTRELAKSDAPAALVAER